MKIEAGSIHTVRGIRGRRGDLFNRVFVLTNPQSFEDIYDGKPYVEYLPVSSRTDLAMDTDFIGREFTVDTEICSSILVEKLGEKCGCVEGQELKQLLNLFYWTNGMPCSKVGLKRTPRGRATSSEALRFKKREFERSQKLAG